jgi:AraC family transcriptional regulator, glycine betaine-responsive activator
MNRAGPKFVEPGSKHRASPGQPQAGPVKVPRRFSFALVDAFSLMSISSAIEPLRAANRLLGRQLYSWQLLSADATPVRASNGIEVNVNGAITQQIDADVLFVCAGLRVDPKPQQRFTLALRNALGRGAAVGAISTGTFVLARADVLDGYRCTVHWEYRPAFMEKYPDIECSDALIEIDRDRYTCSGGVASLDLMLHLIGLDQGAALSNGVANQFQVERIRSHQDTQRSGAVGNLGRAPPTLRRAVSIMLGAIEHPLAIPVIAAKAGLTSRQIERQFERHLGATPVQYYLRLRVERARELLIHTSLPILEVAIASGFPSSSYFSQCYRSHFGVTPSQARQEADR